MAVATCCHFHSRLSPTCSLLAHRLTLFLTTTHPGRSSAYIQSTTFRAYSNLCIIRNSNRSSVFTVQTRMALVLETEPPLASSPRQDTDPVTTQTTGGVTRLSTTDTNLGLFLQILTVLLVVLTTAYPFWFVWHYDFQAQCQHLYLRIMASACLQVSIMQHIIAIVSWYIDDYRYRGQSKSEKSLAEPSC